MGKLSKGKQLLLDYLGAPYEAKVIDGERCVYLDMGDHDIEICSGNKIGSKFDIYVWHTKDWMKIVERHRDVNYDLQEVKELLDDIRRRYQVKKIKKETVMGYKPSEE